MPWKRCSVTVSSWKITLLRTVLPNLMVMYILKSKCFRTCCITFSTCLLTRNSIMESLFENFISSYIHYRGMYCGAKIKLSLCLINSAPCHEDVWGSGDIAPPLLTLVLDGGEWSASCRLLYPQGKSPYWIGGLVGPRASADTVE
jgi:hypothetical protein